MAKQVKYVSEMAGWFTFCLKRETNTKLQLIFAMSNLLIFSRKRFLSAVYEFRVLTTK